MKKEIYTSPSVEEIELLQESFICQSRINDNPFAEGLDPYDGGEL